ncbi:hypothetical protein VIP0050 [Salmonella phage Vi II-E1]|uniref:Conserved hypothetical phage protein n=1 Tax=Salmonella phage Vi II-E1 TaxID=424716 RepID=B1GS42_9CAUD|nr:hypothetical protein VIP0050 [Salmonella phage Vi II-E1]CAM33155.1 conserved hypothetical phage protein [Salmonella phage Vi II-E1]
MSEVKRYDLVGYMDGNCNLKEARMELSDDGVYVKHKDYAALEAKCAALAAENAWLKKFCKYAAFDADCEAEPGMERGGFSDALNDIKTPATDAFLAEVRAHGVEMAMEHMQSSGSLTFGDCYILLNKFAAQLRKGVEQK